MKGQRQESAANGFDQLNHRPDVVSSAYTTATKSEERKRSRDGREGEEGKIAEHSVGILNTLVLSRHILILLLSFQLEPKMHLHSAAD